MRPKISVLFLCRVRGFLSVFTVILDESCFWKVFGSKIYKSTFPLSFIKKRAEKKTSPDPVFEPAPVFNGFGSNFSGLLKGSVPDPGFPKGFDHLLVFDGNSKHVVYV